MAVVTAKHALAAGVSAAIAVTGLITASPALAKSDVSLTLNTHRARVGQSVHAVATGGSDAAGSFTQVCVEARRHRRWIDDACSHPTDGTDGGETVRVGVRPRRAGTIRLRAQLFATDSRGRHRVAQQVSPEQIVHVAR